MMKEHYVRFANYNRWANNKLYDVVARLDDAAFKAPRSGFFPSIARTLNHILVGDTVWMSRFTGQPHQCKSLDQILFEDFAPLRKARTELDERIIRTIAALTDEQLMRVLNYRMMNGDPLSTALAPALTHFFNHQTHHRGQVHAMLSSTDLPPPALDFIYYLREA